MDKAMIAPLQLKSNLESSGHVAEDGLPDLFWGPLLSVSVALSPGSCNDAADKSCCVPLGFF